MFIGMRGNYLEDDNSSIKKKLKNAFARVMRQQSTKIK